MAMNASPRQNINDQFFKGIHKEVWRLLIPAGLTEAEADFIEEMGKLKKGSVALDLMCGYGRHAIELARRGYPVTAVDTLEEYIDELKQKAKGEGLPVTSMLASALNVSLEGEYDAAVCMGNSFAFFSEMEALTVLKKVSAHLKEGGRFIINTWMIGEIAIRHFKEKEWFYAGEYKYLLENKYHFHPARIESLHTIISPDGAMDVRNGIDYIFTLAELEQLLNRAGLYTAGVFSTPRKRPFSLGDSRAYIVAEKRTA